MLTSRGQHRRAPAQAGQIRPRGHWPHDTRTIPRTGFGEKWSNPGAPPERSSTENATERDVRVCRRRRRRLRQSPIGQCLELCWLCASMEAPYASLFLNAQVSTHDRTRWSRKKRSETRSKASGAGGARSLLRSLKSVRIAFMTFHATKGSMSMHGRGDLHLLGRMVKATRAPPKHLH